MIARAKALIKRYWPALRLREILLAVMLFAAAMPAIEALWLRGYENTLVRQCEAELVAQGAALAASAAALWPNVPVGATLDDGRGADSSQGAPAAIDLNTAKVLPERPVPRPSINPPDIEAVLAASRLAPIIDQTTDATLASVEMLDGHGLVVRGDGLGGDLSALPEVQSALKGQPETVLRRNGDYHPRYPLEWLSRASALRLHNARPILVNGQVAGVLLISRSPRSLFRGVYQDLGKIAFGAGLIIAALIVLAGLVSRGITRPIEALSAATKAVAAGGGEIPETPPTAAIEIRALYEDFRRMAQAISRRSRYLRDFAAAVSHEFKTPLASIGGAVELLQDHYETMSAEERGVFLANIAADNARLSHLTARLLDLARADMARPDLHASTDPAGPLRRLADALGHSRFAIALYLPDDLPKVAVPDATLETVLATLIENSRQAGATKVSILADAKGGMVRLTIADNGAGFPAADRVRLFEPFFTTRRAEGGTGLGLPIARSLVETHGGELAILDPPEGAAFQLRLPAAEG